ncbi:T9SS type A sorting domain-containing protein [Sungkyunkwania multivorans]|uniref:T9SS type A sorting domain-containing protein n=1 Tax=Sungkyunkwania multivorans TaxID=1173618 RepID=A0ABW3CXW1_9FLAO
MKKITLSIVCMFFTCALLSQTYSTGDVAVTGDYTVRFDVDVPNDLVTLTLVGPDNVWLGVSPGTPAGLGMGNLDDDAIVYNSNGLEDRNMPSGTGTPPLDNGASPIDEWTLVSDNASGGVITVVATRAINTGDPEDYVFPTSPGSFEFLWVKGNGTTAFGYHGFSNKGGAMSSFVLGIDEFTLSQFKMYPVPANDLLNIELPKEVDEAEAVVYNYLGSEVLRAEIGRLKNDVNVAGLSTGLYMLKLNAEGKSSTKMFVKQ